MVPSSTRARRSKFSSPAQPQNGTAAAPGDATARGAAASRQGTLMKWLEPSVQNKASFEDAGLVRHGVVENMAPLGSLPKPKRSGEPNGQPVRKIILKSSAATAAANAAKISQNLPLKDSAPVAASAPVSPVRSATPVLAAPRASAPPRRSLPLKSTAQDEDEEDDEYTPNDQPRRKQRRRPSTQKGLRRSSIGSKPSLAAPEAVPEPAAQPAADAAATPSVHSTPSPPPTPVSHSGSHDATAAIVERAVDEALKFNRFPTAYALRTLYDNNDKSVEFVTMIEDVFHQRADEDTMAEFLSMMEERKRQGKHDNTARDYFMPPEDQPVRKSSFSPRKAMRAPYSRLLVGRGSSERPDADASPHAEDYGEPRPAKKIKISHSREPTTPRAGKINKARSQKGSSKTKTPRSRKHTRQHSNTSESSLSSAVSLSSPEMTREMDVDDVVGAGSPSLSVRGRPAASVVAAARAAGASAAAAAATAEPPGSPGLKPGETGEIGIGGSGPRRAVAQGGARTSSKAGRGRPSAPKPQPITTRRKSLAAKVGAATDSAPGSGSGSGSGSLSPTSLRDRPSSSSTPLGRRKSLPGHEKMPGRLAASNDVAASTSDSKTSATSRDAHAAPSLATLGRGTLKPGKAKTARPFAEIVDGDGADEAAELKDKAVAAWARRTEAKRVTNGYEPLDSAIRSAASKPTPEDKAAPDETPTRPKTRQLTRQSLAAPESARTTRSTRTKPGDETESIASPGPPSFLGGDNSSVVGSRAATPVSSRPPKKPRGGLRIKSSPVKKKGGTAAGVPRSMGEAQSAVNQGTPRDQLPENDEHCSACGNTGDVVCCDGCPRSFHFECAEVDRTDPMPDDWFCNECFASRSPSRVPVHKGCFGPALNNLEKTLHRAFSLPKKLQNRFDGVKAGKDGDYEEIVANKAKRKSGYDELPDFFKQREDGQAVLCHACQKPATDTRAIIPCSACPYHWHLDCLDPPLAMPPVLKNYRCPAHMDDILFGAHPLAPAHRHRKLKGALAITPALTRGSKNNGFIDVDWTDETEPELEPKAKELGANHSGWADPASFGRSQKLPAKSIILDFIEQVKGSEAGYGQRSQESRLVSISSAPLGQTDKPVRGSGMGRSVAEMQASLALASLKQTRIENIDTLTSALLLSAEPNVISLMALGDADRITAGHLRATDKLSLRAMLAQMDVLSARIRQTLGDENRSPGASAAAPQGATPISEGDDEDQQPVDDKVEPFLAPVTEPTPPSTIGQAEGSMDID